VRFYNKRGTAEQWIKEGKQAVHWPRLSCHRFRANAGPAATERARVQPREPLAPTRATKTNRQLVADQAAAAPRQDGWAAGQTLTVLLAPAGREPPDAAAVRVDAPADRGAARADRLTGHGRSRPSRRREGATWETCRRTAGGGEFGGRNSRRRGGLTRRDPGDQNIRAEQSGRCRMWPIFGSQIGNVG
jgi:hypothetical protein